MILRLTVQYSILIFEEFYQRARNEKKVRFIRSRPSCVEANPLKGELRIPYENEDGSISHEEFDMVVLSIGIGASESGKELARLAGVGLTGAGFINTSIENHMSTSRPGVFVAGAVQGPIKTFRILWLRQAGLPLKPGLFFLLPAELSRVKRSSHLKRRLKENRRLVRLSATAART
jgi:hypothetical protein